MKMMRKSFAVLAILGLATGMSACSKADLPQEQNAIQEAASESVKEAEKPVEVASDEVSAQPSEKKEGLRLVMTEATAENKIEGSEGLAFYGVYAEGEDEADISDAISKKHFFATQSEEGPTIKITAKEYIMGDSAKIEELVKFKIEAKNFKSGSIVKVVTEEGVVVDEKVMGDQYLGRLTVEPKGFYRVEVYTSDEKLIAVSSPITIIE